uniref:Uncharacterized protein n=1 Tax=Candidatus Kentrum sp. SD TaxID=2126332 RepID=A0A450Z7S9_9GAMM|nr:MAG: hypothetical protein BECKSD772E_GA0070983_12651 [Candidatus Kentron sp. SD]
MAALPVLPECIVKENMMPLRGSRGRGVARASRLHSKGVDAFSLIHILLVPKIFIFPIHEPHNHTIWGKPMFFIG